ncbi:MAG TPA: ABC transporter ATP-binding protein [Candidatus Nanoarchaeia archaeon]|nr:ABC transporter ATP-binding protein [Candidatus Nanoarchaeia archaeon]
MNQPAIVIEHLSKKYQDTTALEDLSLQIPKGELFGLLGPNGAGKTTTINILCGLLRSTTGTAKVCGYDVQKEPAKAKDLIGVCIQETAIYPYLTGAENVDLFGNLHATDKAKLKARSEILLDKMGLSEDAKRRSSKYSGGMKRRLSLTLALISDPEIVFLDEPTVALDPQSRHAVWDFLKDLKKEGKTLILTTHYMEEAEELCDRVGIIDHGKLIELGTPQQLISKHDVKNLEEVFIKLTGRNIREDA